MPLKSFDEILEEYPEDEISIVCVCDINILEEPYYYKVVLECKNEDNYSWYPVVEIAPELMHKKYKVGALFKNKKQIGYRKDASVSSFELNTKNIPKINKMRHLINDNDIKVINHQKTYNYFLEQNAYLFIFDEYQLIIPHYTIANHFHFKSSALKHAILDSGLYSLYHPNTFKILSEDKVYLHVKARANKSDLKTICNFLYLGERNNYIKESFTKYFELRSQANNYGNCQIKALFPIRDIFNIKGICRQINIDGKPKLLLLGIYQDDHKYSFNEIDYLIDSYKLSKKTNVPPTTFKKESPNIHTGKIVNRVPSAKYLINNKFFIEDDFEDINQIRLNPTLLGLETNSKLLIDKVNKTVDGSFERPRKDGDENVQGEESNPGEDKPPESKEDFDFEKFEILYESLSKDLEIHDSYIFDPTEMKPKKNKNNYIVSKYFIYEDVPRSYLYGSFSYLERKIIFAEIEHGNGWENISTWFFILDDEQDEDIELINTVIHKYIAERKIFRQIDNFLIKKDISFYRKTHPDVNLTEDNIKRWVDDLKKALKKKIIQSI